ncbi:MAG: DUF4870 domain-containing protein [Planctomycetota bacterium]
MEVGEAQQNGGGTDGHARSTNRFIPRGGDRVVDPSVTEADRTYAMLLHLSLLVHLVLPVIAIIVPLVMWKSREDRSPFVDDHGREVVNFQITMVLYSVLLPAIATVIVALTCGVGFILLPIAVAVPYVLGVVGMILGAIASNRGEYFRYPMTLRLIASA